MPETLEPNSLMITAAPEGTECFCRKGSPRPAEYTITDDRTTSNVCWGCLHDCLAIRGHHYMRFVAHLNPGWSPLPQ